MSIKKSLEKLKLAMAALVDNKAISANKLEQMRRLSGQLPDGSWNPACCLYFDLSDSMYPKVYLYCNQRLIGEMRLNQVPYNARMCEGNIRPTQEQTTQLPQSPQSMPGRYNLPPGTMQ